MRPVWGILAAAIITTAGLAAQPTATAGVTLDWAPCTQAELKGLECASLEVPKDYNNPSAGTFDLALMRQRSDGKPSERIGSLVINLGGPGVSVVPFAKAFFDAVPAPVHRRFDLVLWDPRGVGPSGGLTDCVGGTYFLPDTGPVDWADISRQSSSAQAAANAACQQMYPDIVPYIGTNNTVKDLEEIRKAVGDEKLTFWGTSYGTRIGYVYAHDYGEHLRALLLTSPIDPQGTWTSFAYLSAMAPDTALSFLFELSPGLQDKYLRSAQALDDTTLSLPSGVALTRWILRATLGSWSQSESAFPRIKQYIEWVHTGLFGSGRARTVALQELSKITEPMDGFTINGGSTPFIGCSDYADRPTETQQLELSARIRAQAPIAGWASSMGLYYCDGMTFTPDPVPVDFTNWTTPMLIMGSTRDSLTPYGWTSDLARTFRNSRVITYVGSTHTPYMAGSACMDRYGNQYLIRLKRPALDAACPNIADVG